MRGGKSYMDIRALQASIVFQLGIGKEALLDDSNYRSFKPNNLSHLLVLLSMVGLIATTTSLLVFNTMLESLLRPTAMASCSCRSLAVVPLSKVNLWT